MSNRIVVCSGYFAPLHTGHLAYLRAAADLGEYLFVIVNSDHQARLKGSVPFMNERDRLEIVRSIKWVEAAYLSTDEDRSVSQTLAKINFDTRGMVDVLANGGDVRSEDECLEAEYCRRLGIKMVFGVGGYDKINSSSEILARVRGSG